MDFTVLDQIKKSGASSKMIFTKKNELISITVFDEFIIVYVAIKKEAKKYNKKNIDAIKNDLKNKGFFCTTYKIE